MKRWIICWLLVVGGMLTAFADQQLSLGVAEGRSGTEVTLGVALENTQEVTAVEIVLPLGKSLQYVEESATLVKSRGQDHAISATLVGEELRLYIYSMGLKPLLGNSGELLNFKLKLGKRPGVYTLQPQVVLSDTQGKALPVNVTAGQVTLLAPQLTIDTPVIDFGKVPILFDYTETLTLRNSGTETLEVTSIVSNVSEITVVGQQYSIAPGASEKVTLTYSPKQRGSWQSELNVISNATNGNQKVTMVATPFSKNELHVDRVAGVSGQEVDVVLRMNNQEPIVGMQCEFDLPKGVSFVENSFRPAARAAQHQARGAVDGKRLTLFMYSESNAPMDAEEGEIGRFKVRLNGHRNGAARMEPQQVVLSNQSAENMTSAVYGNEVVIQSPEFSGESVLNMGKGALPNPLVAYYPVKNLGEVPLEIEKVTFLAEGFSMKTSLPLSVQPGQSDRLEIVYAGKQEGDFSTTMNLYTNDPENGMQAVQLTGSLYEPNGLMLSGDNLKNGDYQWAVSLDNYTDIVAVQMDLHWLPGMQTAVENLVKTERLKGHQVTVAKTGEQDYRVMVYSMSNQVITGNSGALFTLQYHPAQDVAYRDTRLSVDNIVLSNAMGKNYASSLELSAIAAFNHFTVKFMDGDSLVKSDFLKVGEPLVLPKAPEHEGYTFVGWENAPETMPGEDVTYFASYKPTPFEVIYQVDGAEVHRDTLAYGEKVVPLAAPIKEGYTFSGWEGLVDTMPAHDVVVKGHFVVNKYLVTFRIGDVIVSQDSLAYGSPIVAPEAPEREGHTFGGWGKVDATVPAHDVVYEGNYSINSFEVIYQVDGAEVHRDTLAYGEKVVPLAAPIKEGHTFSGWEGLVDSMPAHDVVVKGHFVVNKYLVTFRIGDVIVSQDSLAYGSPIVAPEAPEREEHTFAGWGKVDATVPAHDVVYEGSYTINSFEVVYEVDGTEVHRDTVAYGEKVVPLAAPTKEGHTFSGWEGLVDIMPAHDVVVKGYFVVNKYLVTFRIGDVIVSQDSLAYGSPIVAPEAPEKEGHTFAGWGKVDATVPAHDVVYEGSYTVNIYQVIYYVGDKVYETQEVQFGEHFTLIEYVPDDSRYTFIEWLGEKYETMPAHDVEYHASIVDGIEGLPIDKKVDVYTLGGVKVKGNITLGRMKRELPTGVYVIDGKKVFLKK